MELTPPEELLDADLQERISELSALEDHLLPEAQLRLSKLRNELIKRASVGGKYGDYEGP